MQSPTAQQCLLPAVALLLLSCQLPPCRCFVLGWKPAMFNTSPHAWIVSSLAEGQGQVQVCVPPCALRRRPEVRDRPGELAGSLEWARDQNTRCYDCHNMSPLILLLHATRFRVCLATGERGLLNPRPADSA